MCTVSWLHNANGYELFCNRDELKARPAAWPPRLRELHGVKFIAPIDAQHGGSWLAVNQFGTTFSLLNRYDASLPPSAPVSRGLLLYDLLGCVTPSQVEARMACLALTSFQPFTLVVVPLHAPARLCQWNGNRLFVEDAPSGPLTSSSFDTINVIEQRQAHFAALQKNAGQKTAGAISADLLDRFHRSHEPLAPEAAVCMHRAEAQTVSFSHLVVTPQRIDFRYLPHSPCRATECDTYCASLSTSRTLNDNSF